MPDISEADYQANMDNIRQMAETRRLNDLAAKDAQIASLVSQLNVLKDKHEQVKPLIDKANKDRDDLKAEFDAFILAAGGIETVKTLVKNKKRAELLQQKTKIETDLTKLDTPE